MSDRDTLASVIESVPGVYDSEQVADAVIAAGWRPPARVIETAEDLDLPAGTLIVDSWLTAHRRDSDGHWMALSGPHAEAPTRIILPATVEWEPKANNR
jgi:hypothetical protein